MRRTGQTLPVGDLPGREASDLEWLSFEQSGVLSVGQATARLGRGRVRHLVTSGRWRPVCRGVLVVAPGRLTRNQQLWVAVLAAGPGAVLAGATALDQAGVRGLRADPIWVLVPADRARSTVLRRLPPDMAGVVVRRSTVLPPEHLQRGRPWRTSAARAVADAAAWARGEDEARTVVAASCQQRRVSPDEVREVAQRLTRVPRRGLVLETLTDVEGGSEALGEIDLVKLCRRFGLPTPRRQERRKDASGRWRYLDAYWPEWKLHVEVDGAHHMDAKQWTADMLRQNDVWIGGDRILRFPSYLVRRRQEEVADQLRRALLAAGWRP